MDDLKLLKQIQKLKDSDIRQKIGRRISEFKSLGKKSDVILFSELCFCILTANFTAEKTIKIQNEIGSSGFLNLPERKLANKLKSLGHRYPNTRAKYIVEARKFAKNLGQLVKSQKTDIEAREFFAENVKGLGYKEASHFLRNIGFENLAIIDFHILDLLAKHNLIKKPKTKSLTKKNYLEFEKILSNLSKKVSLNLAELDVYLWLLETGKVLK
ncbi:MAG: N-glycosylase [Candidatus Diapherotrites archaeon CG08_land_8_20_14_0_20_34_12]|nr:MAG: N-glycosylase [Candidatus Diapherotrites archaeon CG08_land_8_20_14_0_20_34_12]